MPVYQGTSTSNQAVWTYWNETYTSTAVSTTDTVWVQWCDDATMTTTSISTSNTIWDVWCNTSTTSNIRFHRPRPAPPRVRTAEEIAAEDRRVEASRQQLSIERAKREAAEKRAEELLVENLSLRQREEFLQLGHFTVEGAAGRRYRIRKGRSGNVDVVDRKGFITHRLCAHPAMDVPDYDTMLAQKLMLELDDAGFARIANVHPLYQPGQQVLEPLH